MSKLKSAVKVFIAFFLAITAYLACNVEYQAIKKYYPSLTLWEYFFLKDKLRITPDRF